MNKVYNTQKDFTSSFKKFLIKIFPEMRKTQIKIIPAIIFGMISSENVTAPDITKKLKDDFSLVQTDSVIKRIRRLLKILFLKCYMGMNINFLIMGMHILNKL